MSAHPKWSKQINPAPFDMNNVRLLNLAQNSRDGPYVLFANFACCVYPGKHFRYNYGWWSELYAQVKATP